MAGGEVLHIKKIENAIRSIRLGLKSPADAGAGYHLNKLRKLNVGMYAELLSKYAKVMVHYNNQKDLQVK